MATGDFGPGRMPPDMFLNCNEEIKRQKEQTIRSHNVLVSRARIRNRGRGGGYWTLGGRKKSRGLSFSLLAMLASNCLR